jgi:NDP-sugar pyrophosphorylase family protein
MKAVIIAAGKGERLKPLTNKITKTMVEVAGKPVLEHILNLLKGYGIREFLIDLCYFPESVTSYFKDGSDFDIKIKYFIEKKPSGTAGAIRGVKKFMKDDFIVTAGDVLRKMNISEFIKKHKQGGTIATIGLFKDFQESPRSRVMVDKNGFVVSFMEHPRKKTRKHHFVWSNDSFYVFKPDIYRYIYKKRFCDFGKNVFPRMIIRSMKINTFVANKYIVDIGTFEGLEKARRTFVP